MKQQSTAAQPAAEETAVSSGLGRVLVAAYIILALAATLRGVYQILTKFDEAPFAYALSLAAGFVYIVVTIALLKRSRGWRMVAWVALGFELTGVLVVGTLSIILPDLFNHPSVWSWYGAGYLWIPLVLPVLGMWWLRVDAKKQHRAAAPATLVAPESQY